MRTASERPSSVGRRAIGPALAVACAATLALGASGSATAHEGAAAGPSIAPAVAPEARGAASGVRDRPVRLRECWLTVAFLPPPVDALRRVLPMPLDLSVTFYGPDPLVGVWGLSCDRARVSGARVERPIVSLVGAPVGLTAEGAQPLANNFAHALLRVDTNSRALARALRRRGLPARLARDARFRHSPPEALPSTGELVVPGLHRIAVAAADLDPTNPHDHVNAFTHLGRDGRTASLGLFIDDAHDRFCLPATGTCAAFMRAHRRSPLRDLLGDGSTAVRVAFDHARVRRVDLRLARRPR